MKMQLAETTAVRQAKENARASLHDTRESRRREADLHLHVNSTVGLNPMRESEERTAFLLPV